MSMKRLISKVCLAIGLAFVLAVHNDLYAAAVQFGVSQVMHEQADYGGSGWLFVIGQPYLNIKADAVGMALMLTALPDSNLMNANKFATAAKGDVVSYDYMASKGEYFAWAQYGNPDTHADYTIFLDGTENVYLAFAADYATFDSVRYGWMELGLDDEGKLKVYSSAWDLDGDSIAVGAIPEPSSGLVLLLGVAALALRRR